MTGSYQIKQDACRRGEHLGACVAAGWSKKGEGGEMGAWKSKERFGFVLRRCFFFHLVWSGKTTCSFSSARAVLGRWGGVCVWGDGGDETPKQSTPAALLGKSRAAEEVSFSGVFLLHKMTVPCTSTYCVVSQWHLLNAERRECGPAGEATACHHLICEQSPLQTKTLTPWKKLEKLFPLYGKAKLRPCPHSWAMTAVWLIWHKTKHKFL